MAALRRLFAVTESWDDAARPRSVGGALLTPIVPDVPGGRRNDRATMLRVEMGLASVLLASDVEAAGERSLLEPRIPLGATVLKVGHHGAATSSTAPFLAAVRPTVAIVSVGARNLYGHPDAGTLARLGAVGARVYRTDRDGAVLVETDGRTLSVTRWSDRSVERFCLDPETGYEFLTELIAKHDYGARGVTIAPDEIFVSDGSKSDAANFQELFSPDAVVALTDPVYPVYLDSNVMAGRAGAPDARGGY